MNIKKFFKRPQGHKSFSLSTLILSTCLFASSSFAATYTVRSNADTDGATCGSDCTLRQAINAANANAGADTIRFDLDNTLITLGSPLPDIVETLEINGANDDSGSDSSDSSNDEDRISIDGANVSHLLSFNGSDASGSTFKNLDLTNAGDGILVLGDSEANPLSNMLIHGNRFNNMGQAITASACTGLEVNYNEFSNMSQNTMQFDKCSQVSIKNNLVSNATNSFTSVMRITEGVGFHISNNTMTNVHRALLLRISASDFNIDNNIINCDSAPESGMFVQNSAQDITFTHNEVTGCLRGLQLVNAQRFNISNNVFLNTGRQHIEAFGLSDSKIVNNLLRNSNTRNAGVGATFMITIGSLGINNNLFKNNVIDNPLSTSASGFFVLTSNSNTIFGDLRNTVNNNKFIGNTIRDVGIAIMVGDELACQDECQAVNNTMIGNRIFDNALGHELSNTYFTIFADFAVPIPDGIIHNGPGMGANNLQATPIVTSATQLDDDEFSIAGTLFTDANKTYRIDVYLNDANNTNRQGQYPVGHFNVTTDATGLATFNREVDVDDDQLPEGTSIGDLWVTTSATEVLVVDDDDSDSDSSSDNSDDDFSNLGSTSELSEAVRVD